MHLHFIIKQVLRFYNYFFRRVGVSAFRRVFSMKMKNEKMMISSRSLRNNNPLNIRRGKNQWKGLRAQQEDRDFCQFESLEYGWRAAFVLLMRTYYVKYQTDTIRKIVARWAPEIENDTQRYIYFVSEWTGIDADEPLGSPSTSPCRWMSVALAMAMFEGGLSDATPLIIPMLRGWANMVRE